MKIAVVVANTGNIDNIKGLPKQSLDIEYHLFHDGNLPFPLPNLSPRMRARYIKIVMHRYIPEYDYYIWIDGRAEIISKDFVKEFVANIEGFDVAMFKHWERGTVESEMEFIDGKLKQGNHYLNSRYGNQSMDVERQFYIDQKAAFRQLYATTLFIRRNEKKVNAAFDEWFMRCIEFSHFDQTMYTYVELTHKLKTNPMEFEKFTKHILLNKHIK
jgi:hypothetical protein